jgi:hypothetical protein
MRRNIIFFLFYLLFYTITSGSSYLWMIDMDRPIFEQLAAIWPVWAMNCLFFFPHAYCIYLSLQFYYGKKILLPATLVAIILAYAIRYIIDTVYHQKFQLLTDYLPDNYALAIALSCYGVLFFFISYSQQKSIRVAALAAKDAAMQTANLKNKVGPNILFQQMNNIERQIEQNQQAALTEIEDLCQMLREIVYENNKLHK